MNLRTLQKSKIFWPAERLLASPEQICSTAPISQLVKGTNFFFEREIGPLSSFGRCHFPGDLIQVTYQEKGSDVNINININPLNTELNPICQ